MPHSSGHMAGDALPGGGVDEAGEFGFAADVLAVEGLRPVVAVAAADLVESAGADIGCGLAGNAGGYSLAGAAADKQIACAVGGGIGGGARDEGEQE